MWFKWSDKKNSAYLNSAGSFSITKLTVVSEVITRSPVFVLAKKIRRIHFDEITLDDFPFSLTLPFLRFCFFSMCRPLSILFSISLSVSLASSASRSFKQDLYIPRPSVLGILGSSCRCYLRSFIRSGHLEIIMMHQIYYIRGRNICQRWQIRWGFALDVKSRILLL